MSLSLFYMKVTLIKFCLSGVKTLKPLNVIREVLYLGQLQQDYLSIITWLLPVICP